ncbi:MAG: SGNH/GDSL hydrolase family protein [Bacteroidia bacterium]
MNHLARFLLVLVSISSVNACQATPPPKESIVYLPLGDSYTICQGATQAESWPLLLTKQLNDSGIPLHLLDNPARTGYTTQNLIDRELPLLDKNKVDFVTLCIGVNDWVQGVDSATFHKNLIYILDRVGQKITNKNNIILLTIPDFGVTPSGKNYGGGRNISEGLMAFNSIIRQEAEKRKLPLVDLFPISKDMEKDASLVAKDGLHPSAKEYAIWEKLIFPSALKMLKP